MLCSTVENGLFLQAEAHDDACAFLCPHTIEGGTIMEVIIRKNVLYIAERFSPTKAPRLNLFLEVILLNEK